MFKFTTPLFIGLAVALAGCVNSDQTTSSSTESTKTADILPPLIDYMKCLPQEAALIAAHRGTARNTVFPENSMSALKELISKGYLVSEVDVAGLKDGIHILYHDGVWEEKSTGKGPIASTTWSKAEKILLMDTKGGFSADRPVKFEDYLLAAKGKVYLEIDFKTSSEYETVIELIRKHDMTDQVILISYNEAQSNKLSSLAPDIMLSIGSNEALGQTRYKPGQVAAWIGYNVDNQDVVDSLREKQIPILGRIRKKWNADAADAADLLVTDDIFDHEPISGLNLTNSSELESCLAKL